MNLIRILLAITSLLFSTATAASAYRVYADIPDQSLEGWPGIGGQYTVDVFLDTEGGSDIVAIGVGIYFDPTVVSYNRAQSLVSSYLLYTTAKAPYLIPQSGICDPPACILWPGGGPTKVPVYFFANPFIASLGTPAAGKGQLGPQLLTRLVFDVIGADVPDFRLGFDPTQGDAFVVGDLVQLQPTAQSSYDELVFVPEPTTALLLGVGLASLAVAARRARR